MSLRVFITGASSGIGEYLAYEYAKQKAVLGIAARRRDYLTRVADKCRDFGSSTTVYELDVNDEAKCQASIADFISKNNGIDIVIANAGISGSDNLGSGNSNTINKILKTNILGVTNIVMPTIPAMKTQQSGHIVIVSSVAGYRGLIGRGGYTGSKAAIRTMANGWRYSLSKIGVHVTTICPGFVTTPLVSKNTFPMLFLIDSEEAATKIVKAIQNRRKTYIVPWPWRIIMPVFKLIPSWIIKIATPKRSEF
ncbi:SDR family NAD(P)-dependent oxidoreductase [Candidatus Neomarinimicrobiota bacterium]